MGAKTGFAAVILAALGLRSGQGADAYVFAESDPDVRALLRAYPDPDMLRRIADIIRGWKDEEPRALWERLRAERKARGMVGDADDVGGWIINAQWSYRCGVPDSGFNEGVADGRAWNADADETADRCHRLAEYASNEVASGFERVAGWMTEHALTIPQAQVRGATDSGFNGGKAQSMAGLSLASSRLASRWPPVAVLPTIPDAATLSAMLGTPGDLEGVVIYSDPDYRDTTGYADTCREAIPELARGWDAAGATVCISEAEPLPELPGWHACEITGGRRGQKRTFSKQQAEWLTMNREPAHRVATQQRMFGG